MPQVQNNRFALSLYAVIAGGVAIVLVLTNTVPALAVLLILSLMLATAMNARQPAPTPIIPLPVEDKTQPETAQPVSESPPTPVAPPAPEPEPEPTAETDPAPDQDLDAMLRKTTLRFQALVSSLQSGVLVCDEQRKVAFVNQAFTDMFNIPLPPEVLVGLDCTVAIEDARHVFADPAAFLAECGWILHNKELVVGQELTLADGRVFERDSVPIALDGDHLGHLWQYRDITERKLAQDEISHARDHALEAVRVKSEFLGTMSHEIRTPLNGVIGMAELLFSTSINDEQREFTQIILDEAHRLLQIINNILDFSKLEAQKVMLENDTFDPNWLTDSVQRRFGEKVEENEVTLTTTVDPDVPAWLSGDFRKVRRVLTHLVSNAVKFTSSGTIEVNISVDSRFGGNKVMLRAAVRDSGIGLSETAQAQVFEPFTQVDGSPTRKYGGTGLGLAISRRLVELMKGTIGVEGNEGSGSSFWFCLPLEVPEMDQPAKEVTSPAVVKKSGSPTAPFRPAGLRIKTGSRVLVVDDDLDNRKVALRQLSHLGYEADDVASGEEAVMLVRKQTEGYRFILMDLQMPGVDGFETTREIRKLEAHSGVRTPIIAMTASTREDVEAQGEAVGMDDYLTKPVLLNNLKETVERWAGKMPDTQSVAVQISDDEG